MKSNKRRNESLANLASPEVMAFKRGYQVAQIKDMGRQQYEYQRELELIERERVSIDYRGGLFGGRL